MKIYHSANHVFIVQESPLEVGKLAEYSKRLSKQVVEMHNGKGLYFFLPPEGNLCRETFRHLFGESVGEHLLAKVGLSYRTTSVISANLE